MRRPKVLVIGDAVVPTGYSRVIREIFEPLAGRFELTQLATRYRGGPNDYSWPLIHDAHGNDAYGWARIPGLVDELRPDIVFLLYDLGYQAHYVERIEAAGSRTRTVVYSPIEGGPIEREVLESLRGISRYVVFTPAAKSIVCAGLDSLAPRPSFPPIDVIPHGVDTEIFRPLAADDKASRRAARSALGLDGRDEAFIVLNANRNLPKKRLDITIEGFAAFAKGKPASVRLFMHTAVQGSGWNLALLARRHGIADRLILSSADGESPAVDNSVLNAIYNATDVGVNTSNSEGWGLVALEHACTCRPQILPDTAYLRSIWGDAATYLPAQARMTYMGDHTTGIVVSPQDLAHALGRMYESEDLRLEMADRARRKAHTPEYQWSDIARRWGRLFDEVVDSPTP